LFWIRFVEISSEGAASYAKKMSIISKKYGYARVSTQDQNLDLLIAALKKARCDAIYTDKGISGATFSRPGLIQLKKKLRPEDTLVVWRLDRLGRSLLNRPTYSRIFATGFRICCSVFFSVDATHQSVAM
jgi:predicted site-specific integrase-resolvase